MAVRLNPFRALRPDPKVAARVASPPYDVVSRGEAAELAKDNPLSFLHIVRSDIDLPEAVEPHDASVYLKARENLDRLVRRGALLRDPRPSLYLYRLIMDGRAQVGVVGCVHVGDYYGYGLVAEGKAEIYVEVDLKAWDVAPVKILVEEAGGRLTDFAGRPTIYGGTVLATNGRLHAEALRLLAGR